MAKKAKRLYDWRVTLLRATPAKYLGHVQATDELSAIAAAVKEFKVPQTHRNRIVEQRTGRWRGLVSNSDQNAMENNERR